MKYNAIKNPRWANAEHSLIECEVDFEDLVEDFVTFTASPMDTYQHTLDIYADILSGKAGEILEFIPPPPVVKPNTTIVSSLLTPASPSTGLTRQELEQKLLNLEKLVENLTNTGV